MTALLTKVQLCEYENQTLEAFVAASRLYAKFDCPMTHPDCSLLATAHDGETALFYELVLHFCPRQYTHKELTNRRMTTRTDTLQT